MAIKVALINMKGGVGKSTLAVNIAWQWADGAHVLLVDLDPQFNASQYMLGRHKYRTEIYATKATVRDIFEAGKVPLDHNSVIYNVYKNWYESSRVDLIPSQFELAYTLRSPSQKEHLLEKFISEVENRYDLIIFDCPPTESVFTTAAYLASDYVLVPVKPEFLSTIGLPLLHQSMDDFREKYPSRNLQLAGIVFNAAEEYIPEERESKKEVRDFAEEYDWYVFDKEIPYSRSFAKGAREGTPLSRTSYVRWSRIQEFRAFADEFQDRIGL